MYLLAPLHLSQLTLKFLVGLRRIGDGADNSPANKCLVNGFETNQLSICLIS